MTSNANIAVIGMGCVYPGALSPETLWENILAGRRYFRITPDERLPNEYYFDPDPSVPGKTYCNRMAVIDGWTFDPTQWKIPPITYDQSEIVHWLALHTSRGGFLKQYIDLDYQNWPGRSAASPPDSPPESTEPLDAPREELAGKATEPSMLDLVIDWIVARTGYPREFVTPEKKLRDDLNLDSIKAGELALMLSKQMNKDLPVDLGVVANASIEYLVNSVREFEGQRISMDDSLSNSWIKTFGVELLPAPLDLEERGGLPLDGTVCVIGQQGLDSRTEALAALLEKSAVGVQQLSLQQSLDAAMADDLSGLVLILQEQQQPFYEFNSAQFQESMEGLAASLFRLMQKVLPIMLQRDDFHLLVIRPRNATDAGCDVDGAAGFFKTLSLEYDKPGFNWKWLSLPGQWDPVSIAECAALELQTSGERIEYHYSDAGDRLSPGAVQTRRDSAKSAPTRWTGYPAGYRRGKRHHLRDGLRARAQDRRQTRLNRLLARSAGRSGRW